jgi:Icc-related predicted phosphoesterase
MKVLVVSDQIHDLIYSETVKDRYGDIDLVLSCGDLPYYYLEFIIDALNVPLAFVRGNHAIRVQISEDGERTAPWGAIDLHAKCLKVNDILIAGFEGSLRYRNGHHQYTQFEMWLLVLGLTPRLLWNKVRYGRSLDILISHAPPWQVNDMSDRAHQGFKAFRWFLRVFQPRYHFHGHVHVYNSAKRVITRFEHTDVINAYGYYLQHVSLNGAAAQDER